MQQPPSSVYDTLCRSLIFFFFCCSSSSSQYLKNLQLCCCEEVPCNLKLHLDVAKVMTQPLTVVCKMEAELEYARNFFFTFGANLYA